MADSQTASGLSFLNWWYQPFTEWQKTFMNFIHLEQTVAPKQTVDTTQAVEVNVFAGRNKQDQPVEQEIHSQVGSDGLQIGTMRKALHVLASKLEGKNLTPEQQTAIDDFKAFYDQVNQIVAEKRGPKPADLTAGYGHRLVSALQEKGDAEARKFVEQLMPLLKQWTNGSNGSAPPKQKPHAAPQRARSLQGQSKRH